MTKDKIKKVMDACYLAKRVRDMLPVLPNGVTSSHIHYLDTLRVLEENLDRVKVSDISDSLGLPRPSVTKTIKDMEALGFVYKESDDNDGRVVYIRITESGKELVDKYVDKYFNDLSKDLEDIGDKQADEMIDLVDKLYRVMSNRK